MQLLALVGLMLLLPGCFSGLTGPEKVHAILGMSVHVQCRYDRRYEGNVKYWCRKASQETCRIIAQTSGSEDPVKMGKFSIRDNHSLYQFTVTMEDVTDGDTGTYSCGVNVNGGRNLMAPVIVTATRKPDDPEQSRESFSSVDFSSISYLIYVSFLVLIGVKVPIFLCLVFAIIWMDRRNRQPSDETPP